MKSSRNRDTFSGSFLNYTQHTHTHTFQSSEITESIDTLISGYVYEHICLCVLKHSYIHIYIYFLYLSIYI